MSNAGADRQNKMIAVGAFVLVAAGVLYFELRDPSPTTAPPVIASVPAVTGTRPGIGVSGGSQAKKVGGESSQLDPSLRTGPMLVAESLVYSGGGRNIFSVTSAPIEIPKVIAPARPKGPVAPVYVAPAGPPPPPPIDLKFFGTATSGNGVRQAFLLHGDDVFLASPGDIVQRRYKVVSIAANSIVIEDMGNNNTQTLPLLTN
jgi:hypothetical protein